MIRRPPRSTLDRSSAVSDVYKRQAYRSLMELEQRIERQGERLATLGDRVTEEDLTRYGDLQERFAHDGGYDFHARVDKVLQGLGFDAEESRTRALAGLSGGELSLIHIS